MANRRRAWTPEIGRHRGGCGAIGSEVERGAKTARQRGRSAAGSPYRKRVNGKNLRSYCAPNSTAVATAITKVAWVFIKVFLQIRAIKTPPETRATRRI